MKKPVSKLLLLAAGLVVVGAIALPRARAADEDAAKAKKEKKKVEGDWKKYDKNGNGKLDPDEEAAMKADQEKAKNEKKKKTEDANRPTK